MTKSIEVFRQNYLRIKDRGTERSYYPVLTSFLKDYAAELKNKDIDATAEEKANVENREIGFPDITVRQKERLVGWIEVKLPDDSLDNPKFYKQFEKYKDALENILFMNFKQWQLWQWAEEGKPRKIKEISFNIADYSKGEEQKLAEILQVFFSGKAFEARTTKQLALALAKKTRLLSNQVEEAFHEANDTSDLVRLKTTFEKTLIQNIEPHQFSNMMAETVAYSLFLASLEHIKRGKTDSLTLTTALDYLPLSIPILTDLYELINKVAKTLPNIHHAAVALIEQLNAAEMAKIELRLREHKIGEDPVIHFYEPFLNEYDPKEREARGVYYTPKPVVDYIVKSVDWLLRQNFDKSKGLADESVHVLDPATGTGTFLMSAIQEVHEYIKKQNSPLGDEMVKREFDRIVLSHILSHFYGFELLIAPYVVAHLKLTLEVERLGFDFEYSKNAGDKDNKRFKVYLANTLDDPNKPPQKLFGFESIPQESENAREVKKNVPILVIMGNPPYSVSSSNKGKWIEELMATYKAAVRNEQNIQPLSDDYIKFIRFAHWKISQTGKGIIAFISNNSYLGGLIHRGMRDELMRDFKNIYILNLHGHSAVRENDDDQNVFNIRQGVAISFFIKASSNQEKTQVYYADLIGSRNEKFEYLLNNDITTTKWQKIEMKEKLNFFLPKKYDIDYESYSSIRDIFVLKRNNPMTGVDDYLIDSEKKLLIEKVKNIFNRKLDKELETSQAGRVILKKVKDLSFNEKLIMRINYRPLNIKYIYFEPKYLWRSVPEITNQFINKANLSLVTSRITKVSEYSNILCSHLVCDYKLGEFSRGSYSFPLYEYTDSSNSKLLYKESRVPNISKDFINILSKKLKIEFIPEGKGNLINTYGPEAIFYYSYAIFHSPTYRTRYAEHLKIDFPRLPLTENKKLFSQLVAVGNQLVNLHLFGENPFDKSKTILDEPEKWNVKIGGEKPVNLPDWKVVDVRFNAKDSRIYVNQGQYFEGVEKEVWDFMIGGYQVCDKWLKDQKKSDRCLSLDDMKHYMKIIVVIRETIRIMNEIDKIIPTWPIK